MSKGLIIDHAYLASGSHSLAPTPLLHKPAQAATEEELAPLEGVLLVLRNGQRLGAAELAGHGAAVVVAVGVLQLAPCAQQRSVQLQHRTARPAAHQ